MARGKKLGFIKEKDIWDIDFNEPKVDRDLTKKFAHKHRGSVRISSGRFYTKEEFKTKKEKVLKKPLP